MKFKTMFCALAVAALMPAFAEQTSSNTLGWVKITSGLNATIIGVPWVGVNTGSDIAVANLVKTDNLANGDKLYYYNAGTWNCWQLTDGAWVGLTTIEGGKITVTEPSANQAITRGKALILERASTKNPFYLYGQYDSTAVAAQTLTGGSTETPAYTLLASPKVEAYDLNGKDKITNAGENDTVVIPQNGGDSKVYQLKEGVWGYYGTETVTKGKLTIKKQVWKAADTIPAGTGFWYISRGGTPTINW